MRDVALAHLRALEKSESNGQRYACISGEYFWLEDLANVIKEEFSKHGYSIEAKPLLECPDKDKNSFLSSRWGKSFKMTNEKIKKELSIEFIKANKAAIDMGYSLIKQGLIPDLIKK